MAEKIASNPKNVAVWSRLLEKVNLSSSVMLLHGIAALAAEVEYNTAHVFTLIIAITVVTVESFLRRGRKDNRA
jgi:hypothetical protein